MTEKNHDHETLSPEEVENLAAAFAKEIKEGVDAEADQSIKPEDAALYLMQHSPDFQNSSDAVKKRIQELLTEQGILKAEKSKPAPTPRNERFTPTVEGFEFSENHGRLSLFENDKRGDGLTAHLRRDIHIPENMDDAQRARFISQLNEVRESLKKPRAIGVYPKTAGDGTVTVKYTIGGKTFTKDIPITMSDDEIAAFVQDTQTLTDNERKALNKTKGGVRGRARIATMNHALTEAGWYKTSTPEPTPEPTPAPEAPAPAPAPAPTEAPAQKPTAPLEPMKIERVNPDDPTILKSTTQKRRIGFAPNGKEPEIITEERVFISPHAPQPNGIEQPKPQQPEAPKPTHAPEAKKPEPKNTEKIDAARKALAQAETLLHDAEKKQQGFFSFINIEKKGEAYRAAKEAYEEAKKGYLEATAEFKGAKIESWIDEQMTLTKERAAAWEKEHPVRAKLAKAWNWFSNANALEAVFGNTDAMKSWREFNESSTGWAKGSRIKGAAKFIGKMASKFAYNLGTARGVISATLMGVGIGAAGFGETGLLAGTQAARGGMGLAGGYVAGSEISRGVGEWAAMRKTKRVEKNESSSKEEKHSALLAQHAAVAESLRRGIPNKRLREAKEAELRTLAEKIAKSLDTSTEALQEQTFKASERAMKSRSDREFLYQTAGVVGAAIFAGIGFSRAVETASIDTHGAGISFDAKTPEAPQANPLGWQSADIAKYGGSNLNAAEFARAKNALDVLEAAGAGKGPDALKTLGLTLDDLKGGRAGLAEKLTRALGLEDSPVTLSNLGKILEEHHLVGSPEDLAELKSALSATVSIEIDADNNQYGKALKSALEELAEKAKTDAAAAATLKKFLTSVNMGDIDPQDLDSDDIHRAMIKKVGFRGANGAVNDDVWNVVHRGNRLIITADGNVDVIQSVGKEAASQVDEIEFAKNLARKVGADPNAVSFKNGWQELNMRIGNKDVLLKPGAFDSYDDMRKHLHETIAQQAAEEARSNPLLQMDRVSVKNVIAYERLKGIQGLEAALSAYPGIADVKEYSMFMVDNSKLPDSMPKLGGGTRLVGADFRLAKDMAGSTDGKPELWAALVEREDALLPKGMTPAYKTIGVYGMDGSPKEALAGGIDHANMLKTNLDHAWEATGLSRAETIDLCNALEVGLNKNPMAQLAEIKRSLGGDWSILKVDGSYDSTQIAVFKNLPTPSELPDGFKDAFNGQKLREALEESRSMKALNANERIAALVAEKTQQPEALKALFGVDMKPGKGMRVLYDPDNLVMRVTNVEIAGTKMKEIILNTGSREVLPIKDGLFGGTRLPIVTLDLFKKGFVR